MDNKVSFTYWLETEGTFLGYLNAYPDHWTQGSDLQDLRDHLIDLYQLFNEEQIIGIKNVEELLIA